jgi:hypothetical protein
VFVIFYHVCLIIYRSLILGYLIQKDKLERLWNEASMSVLK